MGPRLKLPVLVVVAVVLHTSVLAGVQVAGVRPDLMLLVAICAGLVAGPERGAVVGFASGLAADVFVQTPLGLSALTFTLVAFTVGTVQTTIMRASLWIAPVTALLASAAGVLLYAVTGAVVGQTQLLRPDVAVVMLGVALLNAPLSLLTLPALRWAMDEGDRGR